MHCVAGDGIGILVGAVIGALISLPLAADFALEYVLGFAFGWSIFQALLMGEMFGSYARALKGTFSSELLSINCLMGGMLPVSVLAFQGNPDAHDPSQPLFWFRMSLALMVGALFAYPMNWWLVAHHLKHGMVNRAAELQRVHGGHGDAKRRRSSGRPSSCEDGRKQIGTSCPLPARLGHGRRLIRGSGCRLHDRPHGAQRLASSFTLHWTAPETRIHAQPPRCPHDVPVGSEAHNTSMR